MRRECGVVESCSILVHIVTGSNPAGERDFFSLLSYGFLSMCSVFARTRITRKLSSIGNRNFCSSYLSIRVRAKTDEELIVMQGPRTNELIHSKCCNNLYSARKNKYRA